MTESRAFNADLRSLVEREGPFVSVYLNTEAADEEGPREVALRWRALRDQAARAGAAEDALVTLDGIVDGAHLKGDGLVAYATPSGVELRRFLPSAIADCCSYGPLPLLTPYLEWQQDNPRYAVVVADRVGAEIHVAGGFDPEESVEVEGRTDPVTKVSPGGWSQRRYQQRAENTWEANAKDTARQLQQVVDAEDVAFVVIAGDVRATTFLREHIGEDVESIAIEAKLDPHGSIDEIRPEIEAAAAAHAGQSVKRVIERFQEERGQNDLAADGLEATLGALRKAQVDTLLVSRQELGRTAWFAVSDLTQCSTDKGPLTDLGIGDVAEADAADVAVRAALGTGARVVVIPDLPKRHGPSEGVGALLRYA